MSAEDQRFWRDPIVIIGSAVPLLILTAFAGYLIGERRGGASSPVPKASRPVPTNDVPPTPPKPKVTNRPGEPEVDLQAVYRAAEPARKLAILDAKRFIPEDDPQVSEIRKMLERAHEIYAQSDEEIVNITSGVVEMLKGEGKSAVGSEILDALTFTMPRPKAGTPKVNYAEMAASYRILREPNRSHTQAVALLQQSYELLKQGYVKNFTPEDVR
jgi:hypothetical protein